MSVEVLASRSFGDWYMDSSILGHAPLAPSVFVGKAFQWIASPLEDHGCEAAIEVVSRALALLVLPVIAVLALLLIPIGLITKSIGGCCTYREPPAIPSVDPKIKPKIAVKKLAVSGFTHIPNSRPTQRPPAPISIPTTYSEQTLDLIAPVNEVLIRINDLLDKVSIRKIDIKAVNIAKRSLESENIRQLRDTTPLENAEKNDPIVSVRDRINIADARIRSLEFIFHYHSKTIEHDGEIIVADNGDCLFEASGWLSQINGSLIVSIEEERALSTAKERLETMQWIKSEYPSNEELQRRLVSSMAEHYQAKLEKLETEQSEKRDLLVSGFIQDPQQQGEAKKRIEVLTQEMDHLFMIMVQISAAFGRAHSTEINFPAVAGLVEGYIEEMSQAGEHGGAAELFALSCRHKVCIHVYHKNGIVGKEPYEIINDGFTGKPPRGFTHTRNHYNPYFPTG